MAANHLFKTLRRKLPIRAAMAFTLAELLVTVSIISLLTGLLLPALSAAKGKARHTRCIGNLKQVATASLLYVEDSGEKYHYTGLIMVPMPSPSGGTVLVSHNWDKLLRPYLGLPLTNGEYFTTGYDWHQRVGVLACPSDASARGGDAGQARSFAMTGDNPMPGGRPDPNGGVGVLWGWLPKSPDVTSYRTTTGGTLPAVRQADVVDPAGTLLFTERATSDNLVGGIYASEARNPDHALENAVVSTNWVLTKLHNGRFSYAFCDGRVQSLERGQTVRPSNVTSQPSHVWTLNPGD